MQEQQPQPASASSVPTSATINSEQIVQSNVQPITALPVQKTSKGKKKTQQVQPEPQPQLQQQPQPPSAAKLKKEERKKVFVKQLNLFSST